MGRLIGGSEASPMGWADTIAGGLRTARKAMGISVEYRRGTKSIDLCNVGVGKSEFFHDASGGADSIQFHTRDYFIDRQALILDGELTLPQRGDVIRETIGETVNVYEVLSPTDDLPVFKFSDPGETQLRVFTKRTDTEAT